MRMIHWQSLIKMRKSSKQLLKLDLPEGWVLHRERHESKKNLRKQDKCQMQDGVKKPREKWTLEKH